MSGLVRRVGSTWRAERIRDWMSSLTSQTLTFMPAITAPLESQNAMNSSVVRVAAVEDLIVGAGRGQAGAFHAEVVLVA